MDTIEFSGLFIRKCMCLYHLLFVIACRSTAMDYVLAYDTYYGGKEDIHTLNLNPSPEHKHTAAKSDVTFTMEDIMRSLNNTSGIDYAYLVREYKQICRGVSRRCRECSCSYDCGMYQTCCPECPYAFLKTGCYNLAIMGQENRRLVGECPITFDGAPEIGEMCASNRSELAPVSSGNLDFRNKYCAECHGVDIDATWEIVLNCQQPIPDNLQIDARLEENLNNLGCVAAFQHPLSGTMLGRNTFYCYMNTGYFGIDTCNVTGLWEDTDPNLVWGCESLDTLPVYDMQFKNVFCYLCNPSIASTTYHGDIQWCDICENQTINKRLLPYGNICGMYCNSVHGRVDKLRANANDTVNVYVDDRLNIMTGESYVDISMVIYNLSDIFSAVQPLFSDVYGNDTSLSSGQNMYQQSEHKAKEQIKTYAAICGDSLVCDKSLLPDYTSPVQEQHLGMHSATNDSYVSGNAYEGDHNESTDEPLILLSVVHDVIHGPVQSPVSNPVCGIPCTCDSSCVIRDKCCADILIMKEPFGCYSEHDIPFVKPTDSANRFNINQNSEKSRQANKYSIVSQCLSNSSSYLSNMCSGITDAMDVFNFIPVISNQLIFKNIYCLMCYVENPDEIQISIQLECDSYLEADFFPDVFTLLKTARGQCKATFKPSYGNSCKKPYAQDMSVSGKYYLTDSEEQFTTNNITFVHKCNDTGYWNEADNNIRRLCEEESESLLRIPEYRIDSKVYKNFACFECNPDLPMTAVENIEVIGNCTDPHHQSYGVLQSLCADRPYHTRWLPYKNIYCAMCNRPPLTEMYTRTGNTDFGGGGGGQSIDIIHRTHTYTYRHLFGLKDVGRGRPVSNTTSCFGIFESEKKICHELKCGKGRELMNATCGLIQPPSRPAEDGHARESHNRALDTMDDTQLTGPYYLDPGNDVLPLFKANMPRPRVHMFAPKLEVYYKLRLRIRPRKESERFESGIVRLEELCEELINSAWKSVDVMPIDVSYKCVVFNTSCAQTNVTFQTMDSLIISYDIKAPPPDASVPDLASFLLKSLTGELIVRTYSAGNMSLFSYPVSKQYIINPNVSSCSNEQNWQQSAGSAGMEMMVIYVGKFLTCPYIVLNETEVDFNNSSYYITLHDNAATYSSEVYDRVDDTFIICKDDYDNGVVSNENAVRISTYEKVYIIFNNVCVILSLTCLLITFATFSIFKTLRTVPGKNIMTLTLSLFLAQLFILIGPFIAKDGLGCAIVGALIHYWWLSMFCAMCACSFHMFRLFYINFMSPPSQSVAANHTIAKYNRFVFGLPMVFVFVVTAYHLITTEGEFTGYGRNQFCFLAGFYLCLFAFVLPCLVITLLSITLFSMSFHRIRTAPQMSCNQDRKDVVIYIKLCTIVGLAWPLQVLDGILDLSVLSFIAVLLNGLQGVFIFGAYICNARIVGLYKVLLCGKQQTTSSDTIRTGTCTSSRDVKGTFV